MAVPPHSFGLIPLAGWWRYRGQSINFLAKGENVSVYVCASRFPCLEPRLRATRTQLLKPLLKLAVTKLGRDGVRFA
ncbi:MAG: hypothetical protein KME05_23985 [Gloeocapsa sp. UFS-A4-WI-NPMV-4B04]|nr:hypothetical protein [Gloeocapsa sp. UFS-A4-WI-NPMV-4B04]